MPRKPAASHTGTPRCISQVAAVWRNVCGVTLPGRPASLTALLKPFLTEAIGLPLNSTKHSAIRFNARPTAHVGQQPRRHRRRGLPLLGGTLADRLSIKDAALQVHERPTLFLVGRGRRDRAGPGTGVDPDQDEPRHVAQGALAREDGPAFAFARMHRLLFPIPPAVPDQSRGFITRKPSVVRLAFSRQRHAYDSAMEALVGMMVDRRAKGFEIAA